MPSFQYEVIGSDGAVKTGVFEAADSQTLADRFLKQGLTVISISPNAKGAKAPAAGAEKKKSPDA
jgi:type II secretory pathway component PulF